MSASRRLARVAIALLLAVLVAAAFDLAAWWNSERLARRVADVATVPATDNEPPELRFARAAHLGENGEFDAAINQYRSLHGDATLGPAARYNAANLLMRQAAALRDQQNAGQAVTLVELAKQLYRAVLRDDPQHWDARYNYERAQRLQPDPEIIDPAIAEPRSDVPRASKTVRGVGVGLP